MRAKAPSVALQQALLDKLGALPVEEVTPEHYEEVFGIAAEPADEELHLRAAVLLSRLYPALAPKDPDFARRTHAILLRDLRGKREMLAHPSCSWLVMTHLREENLAHIPWLSADEVAGAAECFYGFCDGDTVLSSEESHRRVRDLVKYAALHFLNGGQYEEAFQLFTRVPVPTDVIDADLFRLRNAMVLYEQRRVQRLQRFFAVLLCVVLGFLLLGSPLLFIAFESGARVEKGEPAPSFFDGLYWSITTASTLGYGDMVPLTHAGKALAMLDVVLGTMSIGVLAGSILSVVTPRQLP